MGPGMSTLLLKLAAPLQSWGSASRHERRKTRHEPTKSAVIGLIAAAQGRRRTDQIEDLLDLRFGVRIDQPGVLVKDFQTAHMSSATGEDETTPIISTKHYVSDAVFVVGLESDTALLEGIAESLLHPAFPLFLGRRSCAPSGKLVLGIIDKHLVPAIRNHPWEASLWYRKRELAGAQKLEFIRDQLPDELLDRPRESVQDVPHSFSQEHRKYGWRDVIHDDPVIVNNSDGRSQPSLVHDPLSALGDD